MCSGIFGQSAASAAKSGLRGCSNSDAKLPAEASGLFSGIVRSEAETALLTAAFSQEESVFCVPTALEVSAFCNGELDAGDGHRTRDLRLGNYENVIIFLLTMSPKVSISYQNSPTAISNVFRKTHTFPDDRSRNRSSFHFGAGSLSSPCLRLYYPQLHFFSIATVFKL